MPGFHGSGTGMTKKPQQCKKGFSVELKPFFFSAGAAGFEPANVASKGRCLTTWPHPSIVSPKPDGRKYKKNKPKLKITSRQSFLFL